MFARRDASPVSSHVDPYLHALATSVATQMLAPPSIAPVHTSPPQQEETNAQLMMQLKQRENVNDILEKLGPKKKPRRRAPAKAKETTAPDASKPPAPNGARRTRKSVTDPPPCELPASSGLRSSPNQPVFPTPETVT